MTAIYNSVGDMVGAADGNTYITHRSIKQIFKIFGGFGRSKSVLVQLENQNVENIIIVYQGVRGIKEFNFTLIKYLYNPTYTFLNKIAGVDDLQHIIRVFGINKLVKKF